MTMRPAETDDANAGGRNAPIASASLPFRRKLLFTFLPLMILLLLGEAAVRIRRGDYFGVGDARPNAENRRIIAEMVRSQHVYDPTLGFVPRPGFRGVVNHIGTEVRVSIDDRGFRRPPEAMPLPGKPILTLGDSFTFGVEVNDEETWPFQLERITGRPVVNAGVEGWGYDQMVLYAERLVNDEKPAVLIVAIIANDIHRIDLSRLDAPKPYFVREESKLKLQNVPVPRELNGPSMTVQSVLARSRLADALLRDFAPGWYLTSRWVRVQDDAVGVALLLTERLATLAREHDIPMLLVLLPSRRGFSDAGLAEPVLERAEDLGVPTMNLLEKMWAEFHDPHDRFLKHHLDAEGNRWVAEQIAARLRSLNYLVELGETENRDAQ